MDLWSLEGGKMEIYGAAVHFPCSSRVASTGILWVFYGYSTGILRVLRVACLMRPLGRRVLFVIYDQYLVYFYGI